MAQMMNSSNPMQMMMGMLNPSQKQSVGNFRGLDKGHQAQAIADYCNQNGISKEQLANILKMSR
jgi:hypothetical protein